MNFFLRISDVSIEKAFKFYSYLIPNQIMFWIIFLAMQALFITTFTISSLVALPLYLSDIKGRDYLILGALIKSEI